MRTCVERGLLGAGIAAAGLLWADPAAAGEPRAGPAAAWRAPLAGDEVALDVAGDVVVVRSGGELASYDAGTGARRAVLVPAPPACCDRRASGCAEGGLGVSDSGVADAVLDGALVAARDGAVTAVDVRTGRALWRTPIPGLAPERKAERVEDARIVSAGGVDVLGFTLWHELPGAGRDGVWTPIPASFRVEEWVVALDASTGEVRWRRMAPASPFRPARLTGCPGLLLVRTSGRLAAVDPASGAER